MSGKYRRRFGVSRRLILQIHSYLVPSVLMIMTKSAKPIIPRAPREIKTIAPKDISKPKINAISLVNPPNRRNSRTENKISHPNSESSPLLNRCFNSFLFAFNCLLKALLLVVAVRFSEPWIVFLFLNCRGFDGEFDEQFPWAEIENISNSNTQKSFLDSRISIIWLALWTWSLQNNDSRLQKKSTEVVQGL